MEIFIYCLIIVLILSLIFVFFKCKKIYHPFFFNRFDDNGTLHYFHADDFENLKYESFDIKYKKENIKAYLYNNKQDEYKGSIILFHGVGAGHIQYTSEINYFVKNGFRVFTFDLLGTYKSSGKGLKSIKDLFKSSNEVLNFYLDNLLDDKPIFIYGHSLGGYLSNNILKLNSKMKEKVSGIVSLASFNNHNYLIDFIYSNQKNVKILSFLTKTFLNIVHPFIATLDSRNTLKKLNIPTLLIHGDEDLVVPLSKSYDLYSFANEKIKKVLIEKRGHRPNISLKAYEYTKIVDAEMYKPRSKEESEIFFNSLNYDLMVEFDESVMNSIINFYNNLI